MGYNKHNKHFFDRQVQVDKGFSTNCIIFFVLEIM